MSTPTVLTPKQLAQAALTTGDATIYTVPASTKTVVQGIDVCNTGGGQANIRIHFVPSGGAAGVTNAIFYDMPLLGSATLSWGGPQVLETGGFIVVRASVTGVTITVSGLETE